MHETETSRLIANTVSAMAKLRDSRAALLEQARSLSARIELLGATEPRTRELELSGARLWGERKNLVFKAAEITMQLDGLKRLCEILSK